MSLPPPAHLYLDSAPPLHKNLPLTINYSLSPEFPNSSQLASASEKHLQLSLLTKQKDRSLDSTASLYIAENFLLHLFSWKFVCFLKSGLWFLTSLFSSHSLLTQPHSDLSLAKHSVLYLARPLGGTSNCYPLHPFLLTSFPPSPLTHHFGASSSLALPPSMATLISLLDPLLPDVLSNSAGIMSLHLYSPFLLVVPTQVI